MGIWPVLFIFLFSFLFLISQDFTGFRAISQDFTRFHSILTPVGGGKNSYNDPMYLFYRNVYLLALMKQQHN